MPTPWGPAICSIFVVPGGVATDLAAARQGALLKQLEPLEAAILGMQTLYDEHPGLQDRFRDAGRLELAAGGTPRRRGSGRARLGHRPDLRIDMPWPPYDRLRVQACPADHGGRGRPGAGAIRRGARVDPTLPGPAGEAASGWIQAEVPVAPPDRLGLGLIEGWRGPVLIALHSGAEGAIRRCHAHDPSWQNWPLLEYAILDNIVPDFPLINKSFNLSYSGHDG